MPKKTNEKVSGKAVKVWTLCNIKTGMIAYQHIYYRKYLAVADNRGIDDYRVIKVLITEITK